MRKRLKTQLINGIGGVRNQLTQENFFVGVQRVNHQVQQLFNFRLKTTTQWNYLDVQVRYGQKM
ncbi:Uncharacterised protein [Vibrio cholerae]|nr:Uncharacterised protein [Vibrio cholerae]